MEPPHYRIRAQPPALSLRPQSNIENPLHKLAWYEGKSVETPIYVSEYSEDEEELYQKVSKQKKKHEDWRMVKSSLKQRISYLYCKEMYSDFIITLKFHNDRHFPAHRFILALRSCYFQRLFYGSFSSGKEHIPEASESTVEKSLRYLYTDTTPAFNDLNELSEVMSFADMYMISPLSAVCEKYAIELLDGDNACKFFQTAYMLNLHHLKEACLEYYDSKFETFLSSPYFVSLNQGVVLTLYDVAIKTKRKEMFTHFLMKWCRSELKRKGIPEYNLCSVLEPFIRLHGSQSNKEIILP